MDNSEEINLLYSADTATMNTTTNGAGQTTGDSRMITSEDGITLE